MTNEEREKAVIENIEKMLEAMGNLVGELQAVAGLKSEIDILKRQQGIANTTHNLLELRVKNLEYWFKQMRG